MATHCVRLLAQLSTDPITSDCAFLMRLVGAEQPVLHVSQPHYLVIIAVKEVS